MTVILIMWRFHTPVLQIIQFSVPYLRTTPVGAQQKNFEDKKGTLFKDREPQKSYPIPRHVPI